MLVGIVSDIHSNLPALQAVLGEMKRLRVSRVICAGDMVGYYTFPNEVVELAGEAKIHSIAGNHDRAVVSGDYSNLNDLASLTARWTKRHLAPASLETLRRFPARDRLEVGGRLFLMVHGSPRDDNEYVFPLTPDTWPFGGLDVDVLVMGHTHIPWQDRFGRLLVINPGSVGQPRDRDPRAAFATLETSDLHVGFHRADYDKSGVVSAVTACGLPPRLSERLQGGF